MKHILIAFAALLLTAGMLRSQADTGADQEVELRTIVVWSAADAETVKGRLAAGESFEDLAGEFSVDPSSEEGGYMGRFNLDLLRPQYQTMLGGLGPGEVSDALLVDGEYVILQVVSISDAADAGNLWLELTNQALEASGQGNKESARQLFESAVREAVKFGAEDYRLPASLTNLALFYHTEGMHAEAEPFYLQAIAMTETAQGESDPSLIQPLSNLARLYAVVGVWVEAAPLYRRVVSIREQSFGPRDPGLVRILRELAAVTEDMGDTDEAASLRERAAGIEAGKPEPD
jgi:tetratricopeptide (TPR) repeat protein